MSVKVKRGKWLVEIFENSNHKLEPRFTDNKEVALKFNNLSAAIEIIKKLTDYSFDEWAFYENGKLMEEKRNGKSSLAN